MNALIHKFEGKPIATITYQDQPCWLAGQVGAALGYERDGLRFVNQITGQWTDELIEGQDYLRVEGSDLAAIKALHTDLVSSRAPSLVLLFESGVHLAALKTNKPAGKRLRRWLATEVLPKIARGLPQEQIEAEVERRVSRRLDQQRTEEAGRAVIGKGLASGVLKRIQTIAALRLVVQPHRTYASLRAKEEQQLRHALALDSDLPWHLFPLLGYAALEQELYRRERDARKDADALPQYPGQGRWGW